MAKPVNDSGMYCPLLRRPCSKVCHTCELWESYVVSEGGQVEEQWRCAFRWPTFQNAIMNSRTDGMQRAYEGLRNQFAEFKNSLLSLIGAVAGVRAQIEHANQVEQIAQLKEMQGHPKVIEHDGKE